MKKQIKLMKGDNMESLKKLPDNSIDSIVTDPPYGLSFMGKKWDYDVPTVEFWKEVYRVLKPGGHILSFGGTRTYHRMAVNIEDAGFEIRDQVQWIYGSGFPKSHNIGKAVDKIEGNEREFVGDNPNHRTTTGLLELGFQDGKENSPVTKGQSKYEGWGTALKPANEPICVARKPLSEKTIADNVIKWGTGGINIDGCRVGIEGKDDRSAGRRTCNIFDEVKVSGGIDSPEYIPDPEGRFPANIILECICDKVIEGKKGEVKSTTRQRKVEAGGGVEDKKGVECSGIDNYNDSGDIHTNPDCPCYQLDLQSGERKVGKGSRSGGFQKNYIDGEVVNRVVNEGYNDKGGASRFFYVVKVSKKERNLGLDGFDDKKPDYIPRYSKDSDGNMLRADGSIVKEVINKNTHPTLKPINLMTYLCRLITPEGGIVLDPFMGSGSTGIAACLEGFRFVGMELDEDYFKIAESRIEAFEEYRKLLPQRQKLVNGNKRMASRTSESNSLGLGITKPLKNK